MQHPSQSLTLLFGLPLLLSGACAPASEAPASVRRSTEPRSGESILADAASADDETGDDVREPTGDVGEHSAETADAAPAPSSGEEDDAATLPSTWAPIELDQCGDGPLSFERLPPQPAPPDWSEGAKIPITGWANRYGLTGEALLQTVRNGRLHAVVYPVDASASWMPKRLVEGAMHIPLPTEINPLNEYESLAEFENWLHLHPYPDCDGQGARSVPFPGGERPSFMMGSTRKTIPDGEVLTYGCATCHASQLFGRSILGLQNRFPRANLGVDKASKALALSNDALGELALIVALDATEGELRILRRVRAGLRQVGSSPPLASGLDTSLAQVALSLAKRTKDAHATPDEAIAANPRADWLDTHHADTKPGNWWVLKYKNRWLLDGSVVSGNPIYTNLLWNEIGRGTDLRALEVWLEDNQSVIDELTAAVFAAEPVPITDFFPAEAIDLESAKRGKALFDGTCARCHGSYAKGWQVDNAASLALRDKLATVQVRYHEDTPVYDVGTDDQRNQGMESLLPLNDLAISKNTGTLIKLQKGYVPPPLVGIWARFPYFHNNAAPSLCAVLTRGEDRPATYHAGEPNDPETDFDLLCNGYPSGDDVPAAWLDDPEALYDSSLPGLSNRGHDEGVFLRDGVEMFTPAEKRDIIVFLQTL